MKKLFIFSILACLNFICFSQSLGWTRPQIIAELKTHFEIKSYEVKFNRDNQEFIEVTYKDGITNVEYWFEEGIVTQINFITNKIGADLSIELTQKNTNLRKTSSNSWEGLAKGTKIYQKSYKTGSVYIIIVSYYPLVDQPNSNGLSLIPYPDKVNTDKYAFFPELNQPLQLNSTSINIDSIINKILHNH